MTALLPPTSDVGENAQSRAEWLDYLSKLIARLEDESRRSGLTTYVVVAAIALVVKELVSTLTTLEWQNDSAIGLLYATSAWSNGAISLLFLVASVGLSIRIPGGRRLSTLVYRKISWLILVTLAISMLVATIMSFSLAFHLGSRAELVSVLWLIGGYSLLIAGYPIYDRVRQYRIGKQLEGRVEAILAPSYSQKLARVAAIFFPVLGIFLFLLEVQFLHLNAHLTEATNAKDLAFAGLCLVALVCLIIYLIAKASTAPLLVSLKDLEYRAVSENMDGASLKRELDVLYIGESTTSFLRRIASMVEDLAVSAEQRSEQFQEILKEVEKTEAVRSAEMISLYSGKLSHLIEEVNIDQQTFGDTLTLFEIFRRGGPPEVDELPFIDRYIKGARLCNDSHARNAMLLHAVDEAFSKHLEQ